MPCARHAAQRDRPHHRAGERPRRRMRVGPLLAPLVAMWIWWVGDEWLRAREVALRDRQGTAARFYRKQNRLFDLSITPPQLIPLPKRCRTLKNLRHRATRV